MDGMTKTDRPTKEQWRRLFELARDFKAEKPWKFLSDCDIFGLKLPWRDETLYPLVMGNAGEFYGLCVYRGANGLFNYFLARSDEINVNDPVFLASYDNLMLSFLERDLLRKEEIALMRSMGISFRGKQGWPQFRRMRHLRLDGMITADEADILIDVIPRVIMAAKSLQVNKEALDLFDRIPVPVFEEIGPQNWNFVPLSSPEEDVDFFPDEDFPEEGVRRIKKLHRRAKSLQVGWRGLPAFLGEETGDPFQMVGALIVDAETGRILAFRMLSGESLREISEAFREKFVEMLEEIGAYPGRLEVHGQWPFKLFEPLGKKLGIKVSKHENLPELQDAFDYLDEVVSRDLRKS